MQNIMRTLQGRGVFSPASEEGKQLEARLTRFFAREYLRFRYGPRTAENAGIRTDRGPMMEQTNELMAAHYDQASNFFSGFLDTRYRSYSMGYYGESADVIRASSATLEDAQHAKLKLIAERAHIRGDERILNIGCGFGSFETFLLENFPNIEIAGITPSEVQIRYLKQRMRDRSDCLSDGRFKLIEGAFDELSLESFGKKKYDLVVSIALFEQVVNIRAFLGRIAALLTPNGRTFHHFITSDCLVPRLHDPKSTRVGIYFPGGRVWPRDELLRETEYFSPVASWFVNGLNYWRTLGEWHQRFWSNIPCLFKRPFTADEIVHWNEYFVLCKAMFAPLDGQFYGNSHYLLSVK